MMWLRMKKLHKTVGGAYQFQVENGLLTGKIMGKKITIAYNKSNVFNMFKRNTAYHL